MDVEAAAEKLLEAPIASLGCELVACEYTKVRGKPTLRVYVDREGGVGIEDCVQVHNEITDLLDVENLIAAAYNLEVSSPGLERPLRRASHFEKYQGQEIKLRTREPIGGRRNWSGIIESVQDGFVVLAEGDRTHHLPLAGIEKANLKVDYTRIFAQSAGSAEGL